MSTLKRIGSVVEGLAFLALSLCWQFLAGFHLSMAVLGILDAIGVTLAGKMWGWVVLGALLALFNGVAFWEYFRRHRAGLILGSEEWVIFMVPRALDLIWNGSERITR